MSALPTFALSQVLTAFTIDYEEIVGESMLLHALLAKTMPTSRLPLKDLPRELGVDGSGRGGLERHGIVRVTGSKERPIVHRTPKGLQIRDGHAATVKTVLTRWRNHYGASVVGDLDRSLRAVDARLPDDLPDYVVVRFWRDVSFIAGG